jgi:hypothetical protein
MEYLKLTNGKVTVKVIDQTIAANAAWPFQVVMKKGNKHFVDVTAGTNLESAVEHAVKEFRSATYFAV